MQITVNLTDPRANSIALDEVIFSQAETTLTFNVSPATESLADGLSVALLTPQGGTLAHKIIRASQAVLDTSTVECYEFTKDLPIESARGAYLVIGESTHPIAIIPVQVARNPIADLAPPTETAPSYPTRQELVKLLIEIDNRVTSTSFILGEAERIAGTVEPAVNEGLEAINGAIASGAGAIEALTTEKLGELDTAKTDALTAIGDAKTNAETSLQGKVDAATESIEQSTETATTAAEDAAKAKKEAKEAEAGAEAAKEAAETALNNGCVYKVVDLGESSIVNLQRETTIYKIKIGGSYPFSINPPTLAEGEVIVFWLWIVMGETAYELTLPATFIGSEPALAANTETLLALMSTDGGASWQANVQWEKAVTA